ncbi:MAG: glycosyl transferase [Chloroflexi bacterium]|nr:MAG: glycosyl transferase [Chloroflexota bacterium]
MSAIAFPRAVPSQALNVIWARFSFAVLMVVTFVLYMSGLDRNGWANAYYAAAVEAGATNWKAFFFGSLDASNFITVDKSPAFLWVMEISARLFGFNEWSVLVPQALEGVATVALVFVAVRRWFGSAAGLIAGAVVALTPVAALMFRYNNPDALLVLLLTGGAYATLRAVESGSTRWLVLAAALIGTGFLAKMLQAFVVVPVVVLIYLALGRPRLLRRIKQLVIAGFALVLASGWWVAVVELWPSADRPYIGGSQNNSLLNLIFGYNGVGRITGNEVGSVGGLGAVGSRWGLTGWSRLFLNEFGGQISWLIPAALILMAAGLWITLRAQRSDLARASYLMWGGYLLITGAVFSFAQGIIHPYYSIALAPAIGALVGAGSVELWKRRSSWIARLFLASALAATSLWAFVLLGRTPDWNPYLKVAILAIGLGAAAMIAAGPLPARSLAVGVAAAALVAALAGPAAYTFDTVTTAHAGAIPSAGPSAQTASLGPGNAPAGLRGTPGGFGPPPNAGGLPGQARAGAGGGTFLNASRPGAQLTSLLEAGAGRYRWVAATIDANSAAGYELATGKPVMAIGGFNGSDPAPTLAQFESYVSQGQIHYFIAGGIRGGSGSSSEIQAWVSQHFIATTVDGVTVYDLTQPAS